MAIITVSRKLAALGDETARELANQFKYRYVDKSALEEKIKSYGVSYSKFLKYDEKKPSFLASLSQDRDDYLHFLKRAILDEADQGDAIFIGRGTGYILKGVPGVFSVFLVAPPEIRLERVKSYFHCDEKKARGIIEQSDSDRKSFHRYFFDMKWQDPGNYHLCLNTGHLHPALCAEIVKYMRDKTVSQDTEDQGKARIKELSLAQMVIHYILYEKQVPVHFLEASVSNSCITLYGVVNSQSLIEAIVAYAQEIGSGCSVKSEIQIVQEYNVMP